MLDYPVLEETARWTLIELNMPGSFPQQPDTPKHRHRASPWPRDDENSIPRADPSQSFKTRWGEDGG